MQSRSPKGLALALIPIAAPVPADPALACVQPSSELQLQ
jgi:hypothetical protein